MLKLTLALLIVTCFSIVFFNFSQDFKISKIIFSFLEVFRPFLYGIIIAYLMNSSVIFFEEDVFSKIKSISHKQKLKRNLSIMSCYILLIGFFILLIGYIIPEISLNVQILLKYIKNFNFDTITNVDESLGKLSDLGGVPDGVVVYLQDLLVKVYTIINDGIKYLPDMLNTLISSTVSIASTVLNLILGIVISIYILSDKEQIAIAYKNVAFAFLKKDKANKVIEVFRESNRTFNSFFVGKIIDSAIIGAIFFVGCLIIKPSFSLLLSIIIAVTNMIPYFGPFIGGIPVVLITLITSPIKALWIGIFIFILQQFDGIILGPKILGNSIGLKPIAIIFSIIVGGALFGPLGMFFGVPVFAVISNMFNSYIEKRLLSQQIEEANE